MNPSQTKPLQPSEITFKEYVEIERQRLGLSYHAMQSRISRWTHPMDYRKIRRGPSGRAIAVKVK